MHTMEIKQLATFTEIEQAFSRQTIVDGFFASPITFTAIMGNKEFFELYEATHEGVSVIVVKKLHNGEIRLLYKVVSEKFIELLKEYFNPPYIACNILLENPTAEIEARTGDSIGERLHENGELEISIEKLLDDMPGALRRKYEGSKRKNAHLVFKEYAPDQVPAIFDFLEAWKNTRTPELNKFERTSNDRNFINNFKNDPRVVGGSFWDGDKIVAYYFAVKVGDDTYVGAYNKCLRGYHQLGLLSFLKRAEQVLSLGGKRLFIGGINNDFKKQFLYATNPIIYYDVEIFRKPDFVTKSVQGYAGMLIR